jgi:hypothetical protein
MVALTCIYLKLNNNRVIKNRLDNYLIPPLKMVVSHINLELYTKYHLDVDIFTSTMCHSYNCHKITSNYVKFCVK